MSLFNYMSADLKDENDEFLPLPSKDVRAHNIDEAISSSSHTWFSFFAFHCITPN